eukprot:CAMPEP_0180414156 /NCGR_PEP_ID=MMETSP0989-20121125/45480_1 /TAXON_ID=697907 /ORGANISM="non described non described, Strain CCMP2293" /LENGTH=163 /DNA_ID=CAMNT_0022418783 /DNA_START=25 /DNA_END=512 /DNA_ORIENTATION=-
MVNVDPHSSKVSSETLLALTGYRRDEARGRVKFGVLLDFARGEIDRPIGEIDRPIGEIDRLIGEIDRPFLRGDVPASGSPRQLQTPQQLKAVGAGQLETPQQLKVGAADAVEEVVVGARLECCIVYRVLYTIYYIRDTRYEIRDTIYYPSSDQAVKFDGQEVL